MYHEIQLISMKISLHSHQLVRRDGSEYVIIENKLRLCQIRSMTFGRRPILLLMATLRLISCGCVDVSAATKCLVRPCYESLR